MRESPSSECPDGRRSGVPSPGWRRAGKSLLRRGLESCDRLRLRAARLAAPRRFRVAAAVTGRFPLYFHTFAYQELLGLHETMGAEVAVFYLQEGDRDSVSPAFDYLLRNSVRLPNAAEISREDFAYYRRRNAGQVVALLEVISEASGVPVDQLRNDPDIHRAFSFTRKIALYGARYLHTYFFYAEALNGLVARWMLGIPRGLTAYADHVLDDWHLKLVPLHLKTSNVIVATSRKIEEELVAIGGEECRPKILVKPNGVDGRRFPSCERSADGGRPLELVSVSRLEPKKGLLELVDALELLQQRGVAVRAHVVGATDPGRDESAAYAREFEARIERAGLRETVVMHGLETQDALLATLHAADLFVAPYVETSSGDKDGVPTAMLEAMSTALPVVATRAGSIPEVIDDQVEGLLVPQRDAGALADALARLAADRSEVVAMGHRARARFQRQFDVAVTEGLLHERVRRLFDSDGNPASG